MSLWIVATGMQAEKRSIPVGSPEQDGLMLKDPKTSINSETLMMHPSVSMNMCLYEWKIEFQHPEELYIYIYQSLRKKTFDNTDKRISTFLSPKLATMNGCWKIDKIPWPYHTNNTPSRHGLGCNKASNHVGINNIQGGTSEKAQQIPGIGRTSQQLGLAKLV